MRVYGLSIKYIPFNFGQIGDNKTAIREAYYGTVNTGGLTNTEVPSDEADLRNSPAYKPFDPMKSFKRYIRVGKWLNRNKLSWVSTDLSETVPWPDEYNMSSQLVFTGVGFQP